MKTPIVFAMFALAGFSIAKLFVQPMGFGFWGAMGLTVAITFGAFVVLAAIVGFYLVAEAWIDETHPR